jgi:IS30 family transposase
LANNPDTAVVEMDTVEGTRGGKVILTLFFRSCGLQLGFLRDRNTSASVIAAFNYLKSLLTDEEFKILFKILLADRGTEFSNPIEIELNRNTGELLSNMFYCDPRNVNQKSRCERNHEYIRQILPKGQSFNKLNDNDVLLMMNHINSYGRAKLNQKSPIELFKTLYGDTIAKKLGLMLIPAQDIVLKPTLLK